MRTIVVNAVRAAVLTESERNERCPEDYTLRLHGGLHALLLPGRESLSEALCVVAGLDWRKIDTAVPQAWFDDYCRKHGEKPCAWWSYEGGSAFGEPIPLSQVERRAAEAIWGEFIKQVVEAK